MISCFAFFTTFALYISAQPFPIRAATYFIPLAFLLFSFCSNEKACYWGYLYIEYDFFSTSYIKMCIVSVVAGVRLCANEMKSKYVQKCYADESVGENYIQLYLLEQFVFDSHSQHYFSHRPRRTQIHTNKTSITRFCRR